MLAESQKRRLEVQWQGFPTGHCSWSDEDLLGKVFELTRRELLQCIEQ